MILKLCECGCGNRTAIAKRNRKEYGHVKGQPVRFCRSHGNIKHGLSRSAAYLAYQGAEQRCTNQLSGEYHRYGGRGIQFKFKSFEEFYDELGPRPEGKSLDRIHNDGHYEVGNVRWATPKEQRLNQRARVMSFKLAA